MIRTAVLSALLVALPGVAAAQDTYDPWSFNLNLGTDSRSKGTSKTDGDPFAQFAVEWTDRSEAFYVVGEAENIDSSTGADTELEIAAGWRPEALGFDFDLSAAHKWYVGARPGQEDTAWEFTADVERDLTDRIDGRLRFQYSPDSAGSTRSWTWIEARGRVRLTDRIRASAAVGRREQVNGRDYTGWNVGADYRINDSLALDVRWHDTDVENPSTQYDGALVAVLSIGF